jgi:tRNA1Val (adenine37-N6)-methyltransferase
MSNDFFRFKQFTVRQSLSAMKVGVDSVLLGAWADVSAANSVLDVGTGTGLLALMLAQRLDKPEIRIDAVDIDANASMEARQNIAESSWNAQINVYCDDFINFSCRTTRVYDLIISNPPYFTQSMKPSCHSRHLARHNDSLPFDSLLVGVKKLLAPKGKMAVILPLREAQLFAEQATLYGLSVCRRLYVRSVPSKPPYRLLLELSGEKSPTNEQYFNIHTNTQGFSDEYKELTKAFYLKF